MNSTTGFEATAWSIAALVSVESSRIREGVRRVRGESKKVAAIGRKGRDSCPNPCKIQHIDHCSTVRTSHAKIPFSKSS